MIPRLLCEFLSFYLRSSLMVGTDLKNKQTHASMTRFNSHIVTIAKEQRAKAAGAQIGNITLTVRAQLQKYYKHARRTVPYGAPRGSFCCRDKCVFCAMFEKAKESCSRMQSSRSRLRKNHARFTLKRNTPFSGD